MRSMDVPTSKSSSLRQRVFTASAWSLGGYGVSMAIRFGSNLIMTRLLVPEMFGVMAIATIIMVGLAMFSDLGLRQNIVQSRRGSDPEFLNTAWVVQIARGAVLWSGGIVIAASIFTANSAGLLPIDSAYADPILPYVVTFVSFGAVISGFASTKLFEASRNLSLGRITQIDIVSQVCGLSLMLAWAAVDRSIWVLVAGGIGAAVVRVVLSHTSMPGTSNRWHWDREAFQEIFGFGLWIFLTSIVGFLVSSSDRLLLGFMVDATVLGVYSVSFLMFNAVEQVLIRVMGSVAFPALSEVARNKGDLKKAYYRFQAIVASIAYFAAGALFIAGQEIVDLLYDQRYADAGWMLQILATVLLLSPFELAVQSFMALGKPQYSFRILVVRLLCLILLLPLGFQTLGLPGALWGIVASQFFCLPIIIWFACKFELLDWKRELAVLPMIAVGVGAGWGVSTVIGTMS